MGISFAFVFRGFCYRSFRSIPGRGNWCSLRMLEFLGRSGGTGIVVGANRTCVGLHFLPVFLWNPNEIFFAVFRIQTSLLGRTAALAAGSRPRGWFEIKAAAQAFQTVH
jgi:hypothetical protein